VADTKKFDTMKLTKEGGCPYDPIPLAGLPMGMFHCPTCGCMIIAGWEHGECDIDECEYGVVIDYLFLDTCEEDSGDTS
jgi:hypothetical protein